jgi:ABC-type cobalamin transport system ATPase subunit
VQWLAVLKALLGLASGIAGWLQDRQLLEAGKAKAMKEALDEAQELAKYADRVDRDTSDLSPGARQRVRDALRDLRGS